MRQGLLASGLPGMAHLLAQVQAAGGFPHLAPDQQHTAEQDQHGSAEQQLHQALHQQLQYAAAQAEGNALQQAAPGNAYPTYRNKARRKATEKPVVRLVSLLPSICGRNSYCLVEAVNIPQQRPAVCLPHVGQQNGCGADR